MLKKNKKGGELNCSSAKVKVITEGAEVYCERSKVDSEYRLNIISRGYFKYVYLLHAVSNGQHIARHSRS
jgi:hypothetical protein